jgi:hypothetical protein
MFNFFFSCKFFSLQCLTIKTLDLDWIRIRDWYSAYNAGSGSGITECGSETMADIPSYCSRSPGSSWAGCSPSAASSFSYSSSSTPSGPHRSTTCKSQSSFCGSASTLMRIRVWIRIRLIILMRIRILIFICHSHSLCNDTEF